MPLKQADRIISERRASPRVSGPIPAVALDMSEKAEQLGTYLTLDNLSAGGFYVRLDHYFSWHEKLFLVTQISQAVIAIRGSVLRAGDREGDGYGHAFAIEQHQIFSLGDVGAKQVAPLVSCLSDTSHKSEKSEKEA